MVSSQPGFASNVAQPSCEEQTDDRLGQARLRSAFPEMSGARIDSMTRGWISFKLNELGPARMPSIPNCRQPPNSISCQTVSRSRGLGIEPLFLRHHETTSDALSETGSEHVSSTARAANPKSPCALNLVAEILGKTASHSGLAVYLLPPMKHVHLLVALSIIPGS